MNVTVRSPRVSLPLLSDYLSKFTQCQSHCYRATLAVVLQSATFSRTLHMNRQSGMHSSIHTWTRCRDIYIYTCVIYAHTVIQPCIRTDADEQIPMFVCNTHTYVTYICFVLNASLMIATLFEIFYCTTAFDNMPTRYLLYFIFFYLM